jgi:hypothetical protein
MPSDGSASRSSARGSMRGHRSRHHAARASPSHGVLVQAVTSVARPSQGASVAPPGPAALCGAAPRSTSAPLGPAPGDRRRAEVVVPSRGAVGESARAARGHPHRGSPRAVRELPGDDPRRSLRRGPDAGVGRGDWEHLAEGRPPTDMPGAVSTCA